MKFSIVIPSYGQATYLRSAIESALSQTFHPNTYEIIVVDDGSIDGSLEIAREYEPRVKVISQVNKGLASARNAGIMNAVGNFIVPLDADDELMPQALSEINVVESKTSFEVIGVSLRCLDEVTNKTQDSILLEFPEFKDFAQGNRLAYCAAIKRAELLKVGGYSPKMDSLGGWEDLHLWYALMRNKCRIITIPEPLLMYRLKAQSMWRDAEKNKDALWDQIIKDFPETAEHRK